VGFNRCLCSHTGAIFGAASAGDVVRGLEVNPGV
jgi:hypothetical protein